MNTKQLIIKALLFFLLFSLPATANRMSTGNSNSDVDITTRPWYRFIENSNSIKLDIPPLRYFSLDNGLKVYYAESDLLPQANFSLYIDGGASQVSDKHLGLSEIWGDLITNGGSKEYDRDKLAEFFESRGSSFSYADGFERGVFSVQSLTHFFEKDLEVALSVFKKPAFNGVDLALLKKKALQSIKQRKENPGRLGYTAAKMYLYPNSVYSRIETSETIHAIDSAAINEWHKKMQDLSRYTLTVTGNFDRESIKSLLNRFFNSKVKNQNNVNPALKNPRPFSREQAATVNLVERPLPQSTIIYKAPGLPHHSKKYFAQKVYDFLLGGSSFNSHLTQVIRTQNGWAYSVYSYYSTSKYEGDISIFVQTANKNVAEVITTIEGILENPETFVTTKKLEQAKLALTNKFVFLYETPGQLVHQHLSIYWDGLDKNYLNNFIEQINQVTKEDILKVARRYYRPESFMVTVVAPPDVKESLLTSRYREKVQSITVPE